MYNGKLIEEKIISSFLLNKNLSDKNSPSLPEGRNVKYLFGYLFFKTLSKDSISLSIFDDIKIFFIFERVRQ